MLFEFRIRFTGDEGDEMAVLELVEQLENAIKENANVTLRPIELHVLDPHPCSLLRRKRAARN